MMGILVGTVEREIETEVSYPPFAGVVPGMRLPNRVIQVLLLWYTWFVWIAAHTELSTLF